MLLTAFNSADIIRVEISLFREPFLTQMQPFPFFADGGTKNNAVIRRWHSLKGKQGLPHISTPLNG
jgi:hypothetical protein